MILFILLIFLNSWIWRIFSLNILIGVVCVFTTTALYFYSKDLKSKLKLFLFIVGLIFLSITQVNTNEKRDLFIFSNDQIRIRNMRILEYPILPVPIGYWFEQRKEFVAYFRMKENLAEALDTNLYFFANHPRSRVGINEFEKFSYFYIPFFILGIFSLIEKQRSIIFIYSFFIPITVLTVFGNRSLYGPLVLFPFFVVSIYSGFNFVWENIKKN